ncbi:hypothetical protein [Vannielia litorea]|uniref:hypothetical protein n=1 Tax=Vannielia litorea TaxID=1217970 RepID=UPI001C987DFB|nr:hypothetical protein [Vannielia litorea]MBY6048097.1 hypothetical protein [Vannielia litorea]MBY6075511.1 hypothetical protein [Vannielia litorea]
MKHLAAMALAASLTLGPALAQEADPEARGDMGEGMNLVEEGMMLFFRGLAEEMEPALKDMARDMEPALRDLAETLGPQMAALAEMIGEFDDYHPPERLENGDIIIRRKTPKEMERAPEPLVPEFDPEGEIEL